MAHHDVIRAWKDADYRASLGETERAALPTHPAGAVDLTNAELDSAVGGGPGFYSLRVSKTLCCPPGIVWG